METNTIINEHNKVGPILLRAYAISNINKQYIEIINSEHPNERPILIRDLTVFDSRWGLLMTIPI